MFIECSTESYDFEPSSARTIAKRKSQMAEPSYFDYYRINAGESNKSVTYDYYRLNINVRWKEGYVKHPFTTGQPQVTCTIDSIREYPGELNIKRKVIWELLSNIIMPGDGVIMLDYSVRALVDINLEDSIKHLKDIYDGHIEIPATIERQYSVEQ